MKQSEMLVAARDWLKVDPENRWAHHAGNIEYNLETKRYEYTSACTITSFAAAGVYDLSWPSDLLRKAIAEKYPAAVSASGIVGISEWNDNPERTFDQVVSVFDRAIEIAEKEEKEAA